MRDENEEDKVYLGRGWNFIRLDDWPEWIAAPLAVFGFLILICLLAVGVSIIFTLVQRVWHEGTDTVQAASVALTAIAAIFGAAFLTWRTVVAHWQARASQEQALIQRETLYTNMFTKAVEQLGATREIQTIATDATTTPPTIYSTSETQPNLEVRLGAIYAFERISRDSEKDHRPILEVLCAYIRNHQNSGEPKTDKEIKASGRWPDSIPPPRVDIQAALSVRDANFSDLESKEEWRRRGPKFQGAVLFEANFSHAVGLRSEHLIGSFGDASIVLPPDVNPPEDWPKAVLNGMERIDYRHSMKT